MPRFSRFFALALVLAGGCARVHLGIQDGGGDSDGGSGPVPCGPVLCEAGQICCDPTCGICGAPEGACPAIACPPDGCTTDSECAPSDFCGWPDGQCGPVPGMSLGTCMVRPDVCTPVIRETCGCDAVTYQSPCDAQAAGTSIAHDGACEAPPCASNADCSADQFCFYSSGACVTDGIGECVPRPSAPVACPLDGSVVCGCDGHDYLCELEANAAGTSVLHPGSCAGPCAAMDANGSGDCALALGVRWNGAACEGISGCSCVGADCAGLYTSVDACVAAYAGCDHPPGAECGGLLGNVCRPDEYCDYPDPSLCGATDETGVCTPRPATCPTVISPACGCDGTVYDNSCYANQAGWDTWSDASSCGAPPP